MDFADMAALNGQYAFHCPSTSIPGCPAGYASSVSGIFGLAINDSNQLLVDLELGAGPDLQIKGILSPFAVPEPSALLLLATAVCLGVLKLARRRYSI